MPEVKRSQLAHFLNTTPTATAATYSRLGFGVTGATMNYQPQSETVQYIHQDSANTNVSGYQPNMPVEQKVYPGDALFDFVDNLRQTLSIGGSDLTDIVEVRLYETPGTGGNPYPATKWNVQIQFDSVGGDGGSNVGISWTINILGDPIPGTFNTSTGAFAAT